MLSLDIDGNDYWVWEAINVTNPVVITVEYNSTFGSRYAVTVPSNPIFHRTQAHYSNLYWGVSLKALCILADRREYALVGCNSNGNNAHCVRNDKVGAIPVLRIEEGYVESRFRESRAMDGGVTFLRGDQRLEAIKNMPVLDVDRGIVIQIKDLS